MTEELNDLKAT